MLVLRIEEKGRVIEFPGLSLFRTPADIDISKVDIEKLIIYLKSNGIKKYKIIDLKNKEKIKKKKSDPYESRFSRIEKMLSMLLQKETRNEDENKEQITEKLDQLEKLSKELLKREPKTVIIKDKVSKKKEDEDEFERFIPEVDIGNMKLTSSSVESLKGDKGETDNAADALSKILGGKK